MRSSIERGGRPSRPSYPGSIDILRFIVFQIVGSLLALVSVIATLAAEPVYGFIFAVATLCWIVKAMPARPPKVEYYSADGEVVVLS